MAFSLTKPIWALICLHGITRERVAALTDNFADVFVRKIVAHLRHCGDIMTSKMFDADTILFREIQCKKMYIFMFKWCFQCSVGWNQVKYARITVTHVCFIALTLAWSLGRFLNTRPNGLVFKQLPCDPTSVNAWNKMCDSYIISCDINCIFSAAFFDSHINKPMGKLGFLKRNQNVDTWTAINTNGLTLIDQQKCVSHCISTIYHKKNLPSLMFCPKRSNSWVGKFLLSVMHTGLDKQNFSAKNVNIFLPISSNICFGCSKEQSHWDGSSEYPQHMFWLRNKKKSYFLVHTLKSWCILC